MNHEEALTVTQMVVTTWPSTKIWTAEEMSAYATGLMRYDAEHCTKAVAAAQQKLMYRPSRGRLPRVLRPRTRKNEGGSRASRRTATAQRESATLGQAVVAARYLHAKFGKDQDMRRFPEQQDWGNPDMPLMPADQWLEEAEHVTDRQVWNTLLS